MSYPIMKSFKQQGVVLFVALIALVVMSLAAVALIRSVDTNTIIAGNMALKHGALISSDRGVETAITWLDSQATANKESLYANNVTKGYYATYTTLNLDDPTVLKNPNTWLDAVSAEATGNGITGGAEASSGNKIRFIIQRMCRDFVAPSGSVCLLGAAEIGNGSKAVVDSTRAGAIINSQQSPAYRITTRVVGVKNTYSYAQTYVY